MLYIGADHGGFRLKESLKKYLTQKKIAHEDVGARSFVPRDDYPKFAQAVARKVSHNPTVHTGILLCRSGQGVNIVANKFPRVRAALVWNTKEAKMSRVDDMTNVLCLPSDYVSGKLAQDIVKVWLATPYSKEQRHVRRIEEISKIERRTK